MTEPRSRAKLLAFILLPAAILFTVFALGLFCGRRLALRPIEDLVNGTRYPRSLGDVIDADEREGVAAAYLDPAAAGEKLDELCWSIPNTLAPFVGHGPAPGRHLNTHINRLQFRDDREVDLPKPPGVYRVFITGGSTAFGSGAPGDDRTIGGYLEAALNRELGGSGRRYEVFTLANPAWASTHERIMIENRLSELDPDLVISFSGNNDVHWGYRGEDILWFRTYADAMFKDLADRIHRFVAGSPMPDVVPSGGAPAPPEVVARRLAKNARLSALALEDPGAAYAFVLQPTLRVSGKKPAPSESVRAGDRQEYFARCYEAIRERLSGLAGLHFLDQSRLFDHLGADEAIFLDSYHFGDKGNEMVALDISRRLRALFERGR